MQSSHLGGRFGAPSSRLPIPVCCSQLLHRRRERGPRCGSCLRTRQLAAFGVPLCHVHIAAQTLKGDRYLAPSKGRPPGRDRGSIAVASFPTPEPAPTKALSPSQLVRLHRHRVKYAINPHPRTALQPPRLRKIHTSREGTIGPEEKNWGPDSPRPSYNLGFRDSTRELHTQLSPGPTAEPGRLLSREFPGHDRIACCLFVTPTVLRYLNLGEPASRWPSVCTCSVGRTSWSRGCAPLHRLAALIAHLGNLVCLLGSCLIPR